MQPDSSSAATTEERIARLEQAVQTLAWWLVQCQSGFGELDARGIENIVRTGNIDGEAT
jgi:hypothetical protein